MVIKNQAEVPNDAVIVISIWITMKIRAYSRLLLIDQKQVQVL